MQPCDLAVYLRSRDGVYRFYPSVENKFIQDYFGDNTGDGNVPMTGATVASKDDYTIEIDMSESQIAAYAYL